MKNAPLKRPLEEETNDSPFRDESSSEDESSQVNKRRRPNNEIIKELIKLIPRYDGSGGIQPYFEFVENFEDFVSNTEMTSQSELTLATAKLTGDAKTWWRRHRMKFEIQDPLRIRNWESLKDALRKTFVPAETNDQIRLKIRNLKQTDSVAEYNTKFRHLNMLITMSFDEARHDYVQGLKPRIRELIRTKDNLEDIDDLMLACLHLEDFTKTTDTEELAASSILIRPKFKCNRLNDMFNCPNGTYSRPNNSYN